MAKQSSASLDDLLKQAKTTNRLLAAQLKSQMSQMELVGLLMSTGLTNQELAEVLDTTAATVAVTLQRIRKKAAAKSQDGAAAQQVLQNPENQGDVGG